MYLSNRIGRFRYKSRDKYGFLPVSQHDLDNA